MRGPCGTHSRLKTPLRDRIAERFWPPGGRRCCGRRYTQRRATPRRRVSAPHRRSPGGWGCRSGRPPQLVWAVNLGFILSERKYQPAMVAVSRADGAPPRPRVQALLLHQAPGLPRIHGHAPMTKFGIDPAAAVALELVIRPELFDDDGVLRLGTMIGVEAGPRGVHQLASPPDRDPSEATVPGPGPFLGERQRPASCLTTTIRASYSAISSAAERVECLAAMILGDAPAFECCTAASVASAHGLSSSEGPRRVNSTGPPGSPASVSLPWSSTGCAS